MRTCRWVRSIAILPIAIVMLGMTQYGAEAVPPVTWKLLEAPSTLPGNYCGGDPQDARGLSLDLNAECKALYGPTASAAAIRQDAYGWVCKVPGQPDKGLNMQAACRRTYGGNAIATLSLGSGYTIGGACGRLT